MSKPPERDIVYLDNQATTPVDERVLGAMLPWFSERFGNAASATHRYGTEANAAVDQARRQVAALIGARPTEIVFTSGATESNNLAIKGAAHALGGRGRHLVSCVTEHPAVLDPLRHLCQQRCDVTLLPVGQDGHIDLAELEASIRPDTILVTLMAANNEIGTLHPVAAIGEVVRRHGVLFHCDAAQAVGKVRLDVEDMQIDLLSMSAHKLYGPKGAGALFVRREVQRKLSPLQDGGGHERGLRSGTVNTPGCVGLGVASALSKEEMAEEAGRLLELRELLRGGLEQLVAGMSVNGDLDQRLPGNLHVTLPDVDAEVLIANAPGVAVSTGSACASAAAKPSHVLEALGLSSERAEQSLRFGLGRFTTHEDVASALERLGAAIERIGRASQVGVLPSAGARS